MNDYNGEDAAFSHGIKPEDYGKCSHAIVDPNSKHKYEIGLVKNPNGEGYIPIVDFWGMSDPEHIANKVGKSCEVLAHAHTKDTVLDQYYNVDEYGMVKTITETVDEDGYTVLVLEY